MTRQKNSNNPLPSSSSSSLLLLLLLLLLILINLATMAESFNAPSTAVDSSSSSKPAAVYIVYTERPLDEEPDAYNIRTLSSVFNSEEAAKEALIYSYKNAASGFSAKLTPHQVEQISKLPGVLHVAPSRQLHLHSGPGNLRKL